MNRRLLIQKLINAPVTSVKSIHHGVSNTSFLVNHKYVVRIKNNYEYFYHINNEKEILNKISKLGLSEQLIALDKDGNKVSKYIPYTHTYAGKDNEIIKTAKMLKKLHNAKIKTNISFDAFKRYRYYKGKCHGSNFIHEKIILESMKKLYQKYPLILCHNDVVDNNLLFTKEKSYLIDYEFAGKNIAIFDLASFLSENNIFNETKIGLFLKAYKFPAKNRNDLNIAMIFLNLLWYYWALERYQETKKDIYRQIAKIKKQNIQKDIKSFSKKDFS